MCANLGAVAGSDRLPPQLQHAVLQVLAETGWLAHFPELAALAGVPQEPEWHPEGDVFVHTGHCVDALARLPEWQTLPDPVRRDVMFAVLAHDFGKPATTINPAEIVGLYWYFSWGGGTDTAYDVDLTMDDLTVVTQ